MDQSLLSYIGAALGAGCFVLFGRPVVRRLMDALKDGGV
jgi:hypothetical protein